MERNKSQRGYNSANIQRNVHIEVGIHKSSYSWGSTVPSWGGHRNVILSEDTKVLIANSISNTCRVWNTIEKSETLNGDLSHIIDKYPEHTGIMLQAGELVEMSIFTPHECVAQPISSHRQFFRIVGQGVQGREPYFTPNPKLAPCKRNFSYMQ